MLFNKITFCAGAFFAAATFTTLIEAASTPLHRRDNLAQCASTNPRSEKIKQSFLLAYDGYKKFAWGHDELLPVSHGYSDSRNGWGATIVDALDTMIIMGLLDEYKEALEFVKKIDFTQSQDFSKGFETNIRYLGGLLSANDLMPDPILVQKAVEVAEATLVPLFIDSTSLGSDVKVPLTYFNLNTNKPVPGNTINLAEFGTYTMEFTRLSQVTGDPKYEKLTTDLINAAIKHSTRMPGLFPTTWTAKPFAPVDSSTITIAGGGDSFYEYLIKNYILQSDKNPDHKQIWEETVDSIEKYMLSPTLENPDIKYVAMIGNSTVYYSSQELICYWPGNILLGLSQMDDENKKSQFKSFAKTFLTSCVETWEKTKTTIAPESWSWTPKDNELGTKLNQLFDNTLKGAKKRKSRNKKAAKRSVERIFSVSDAIYDLRPETMESVFYYYRMTGDTDYQELAWKLFLGVDQYAKVDDGFTRVDNVDKKVDPKDNTANLQDFQESFFLAETLKYLYLTFSDKSCISLNDYVFNTEAHPFKLSNPIQFQS